MQSQNQFTIINLCDIETTDVEPEEPYYGQMWMDTSTTPPTSYVWDGAEWVEQNKIEEIRTEIETIHEQEGVFQSNLQGISSVVSDLNEKVEVTSQSGNLLSSRVVQAEQQISSLQQTVNSINFEITDKYVGGVNFIKNSAGLNGISDDWSKSGSVAISDATDILNNTASKSAFVLTGSAQLQQEITNAVLDSSMSLYIKAKKDTSSYNSYVRVKYNGNQYKYAFEKTTAFGWSEFSLVIDCVRDSIINLEIYNAGGTLYVSDIMLSEGSNIHKWTPASNEIYTKEVKIDSKGISVSSSDSAQRTVINNTEFSGYYNNEKIFTLNKDETKTKKTTVDGDLTVGKVRFSPTSSGGLNIVVLD